MSVIHDKAVVMLKFLGEKHGVEFDAPVQSGFLDFLEQLLASLLPMLLNCIPKSQRTPEGFATALQNPNFRQRAGVRWAIARNIDDPRSGNVTRSQLEEAFYHAGNTVSTDDSKAMMAEVA